jgi:hypothetical protein
MAYMFDNYDRASSGICYIKNTDILTMFLADCTEFITNSTEFMSEMTVLFRFYMKHTDRVQLLPILWEGNYSRQVYENSYAYEGIFDAAALGIYIGGMDIALTGGKVIPKAKMRFSMLDYEPFNTCWKNEGELRIPYIQHPDGHWVRINNLHLHSKVFTPHLSKTM